MISLLIGWRDRKTPGEEGQALLDIAEAGELTSPGRWNAWLAKVRRLPGGLRSWMVQKFQDRFGPEAAEYLMHELLARRKS